MDRNGIVAVLLLFLIVAHADVAPVHSTDTPVSPSPPPNPEKKLDQKPNNVTDPKQLNNSVPVSPPPQNLKSLENIPKDSTKTDTVTVTVSPNNTVTDTTVIPPPLPPTPPPPPHQNNTDDGKKKSDDKSSSVFSVAQNCTETPCEDKDNILVACISSFDRGSKELVVLVQNGGNETLEVKFSVSSSVKNPLKALKILPHQIERIDNLTDVDLITKLIFNAGHGECVLHLNSPVSEGTYFLHLPSYDKLVTPINGAYLLILTGIIFGGTWTCCMFRKRRRQGGVPYQELEMGLPESVSATDVETVEGWDQGWDDDWDEENAVKSPGGRHVGSISANGLTSRSSNKDGWENDWDD